MILKVVLVIGDRERCLQAGVDNHITSEYWEQTFSTVSEQDLKTSGVQRKRLVFKPEKIQADGGDETNS